MQYAQVTARDSEALPEKEALMQIVQVTPQDMESLLGKLELETTLGGRRTVEPQDQGPISELVGRKRLALLGVKGLRARLIPDAVFRALGEDRMLISSMKKQMEKLQRERGNLEGQTAALEGEVQRLRKDLGEIPG